MSFNYCCTQRGDGVGLQAAATTAAFADITGLASARNYQSFLLQTNRLDMGERNFIIMKKVVTSITVKVRYGEGSYRAFLF